MADEFAVDGLSDLLKALEDFPDKLTRNACRGGISAASKTVVAEAKRLCPDGPASTEGARLYGGREGLLRDSIKARSTKIFNGTLVVGGLTAGGDFKGSKKAAAGDAFYAHFVEFGTAAHVITAGKGHALAIGGGAYKSVKHPGAKKQPFMRPALDHMQTAAVQSFADYVSARIDKAKLDQADPNAQ
jgi:HK97 gp10 family phage protein